MTAAWTPETMAKAKRYGWRRAGRMLTTRDADEDAQARRAVDAAVEAAAVVLAGDSEVEWGVRCCSGFQERSSSQADARKSVASLTRGEHTPEVVSRRVGPWEVAE